MGLEVPAGELAGDEGPFVAHLVLDLEKFVFLLQGPLGVADALVQVVVVSRLRKGYLSRHCLPLRPWMLNYFSIA